MSRMYRKFGSAEWIRIILRGLDFIFLMRFLSSRYSCLELSSSQKSRFLELGPGPLKLRSVKHRFFGSLNYVDHQVYRGDYHDVKIFDLEKIQDLHSLDELCVDRTERPLIVFADHCLEHLSHDRILDLIRAVNKQNASIIFRVPNVFSNAGLRNFNSDDTHRTEFNEEFRATLRTYGVEVFYWIRFYRGITKLRTLFSPKSINIIADEVLFVRSGKFISK